MGIVGVPAAGRRAGALRGRARRRDVGGDRVPRAGDHRRPHQVRRASRRRAGPSGDHHRHRTTAAQRRAGRQAAAPGPARCLARRRDPAGAAGAGHRHRAGHRAAPAVAGAPGRQAAPTAPGGVLDRRDPGVQPGRDRVAAARAGAAVRHPARRGGRGRLRGRRGRAVGGELRSGRRRDHAGRPGDEEPAHAGPSGHPAPGDRRQRHRARGGHHAGARAGPAAGAARGPDRVPPRCSCTNCRTRSAPTRKPGC